MGKYLSILQINCNLFNGCPAVGDLGCSHAWLALGTLRSHNDSHCAVRIWSLLFPEDRFLEVGSVDENVCKNPNTRNCVAYKGNRFIFPPPVWGGGDYFPFLLDDNWYIKVLLIFLNNTRLLFLFIGLHWVLVTACGIFSSCGL